MVELVLGTELVAQEKTEEAEFELAAPIDYEDWRLGRLRLSRISVKTTRLLGKRVVHPDEDDSPIIVRADGFVQPLTKTGQPNERRQPYWTDLPDKLVPILLGRAAVAP